MTPSTSFGPFARLAVIAGALATAWACSVEQPTPGNASKPAKPAAAANANKKAPAKSKVEGLKAGPYNLGPLKMTTVPTVESIDEALADKYTVQAAGEGATEGANVQVLLEGAVIAEIFPSEDGTQIAKAVSRHKEVVFPWDSRVGDRIGDHKHFNRMTCTPAQAPFKGEAICAAFEDARIVYLIKGWEGDTTPGKELLADNTITGLLWLPRDKDAE